MIVFVDDLAANLHYSTIVWFTGFALKLFQIYNWKRNAPFHLCSVWLFWSVVHYRHHVGYSISYVTNNDNEACEESVCLFVIYYNYMKLMVDLYKFKQTTYHTFIFRLRN
ncbi:hypothetical protein ILUMI_06389 [Ignelater luminosus]|uniref:Uncharacterized protein n=1 Tax=Ignelater luminosus TaxID=2038154 RepID=A0A8K0GHT2_IGNLU|nr:hypothetical protein ILUMI_06389 [Ignelater luminosus]